MLIAGIIIGLFIGIPIVWILLSMMVVAQRADEQSERMAQRKR